MFTDEILTKIFSHHAIMTLDVNYSDFYKSELPASTTTALATMIRNGSSYTVSTGV